MVWCGFIYLFFKKIKLSLTLQSQQHSSNIAVSSLIFIAFLVGKLCTFYCFYVVSSIAVYEEKKLSWESEMDN